MAQRYYRITVPSVGEPAKAYKAEQDSHPVAEQDGRHSKGRTMAKLSAAAALCLLFKFSHSAVILHKRVTNTSYGDAPPIPVTIPWQTPEGASAPIDPNFPGFAFETASFVTYLGNSTHKNEFSNTLIDQIVSRTGGIPLIRSGGTSGDNATYDHDQDVAVKGFDPNLGVGQLTLTIGPSYFDSFKNVPNALYVPQFPLAKDNLTNALAWAKDAVPAIGLENIDALELGNEPSAWRVDEQGYVDRFLRFESAITDELGLQGKTIYQGISGASQASITVFNGTEIMLDGLDSNGAIKQVSYHYYQTTARAGTSLQDTLMNHVLTKTRLDIYIPFLAFMRQNYPSVPVIMGEVGNSLRDASHPNAQDFQSVLGSALWQVDFQLYIMSIGFARINMQQLGLGTRYNMWYPETDIYGTPAQVLPPFYAQPFVADFISKGGRTQVFNFDLDSQFYSAYAGYEDGELKRIALINLKLWDQAQDYTPRPETLFKLDVGYKNGVVKVEALTAPEGARARETIAYANTQWTFDNPSGFVPYGRNDTRYYEVKDGKVDIPVPASSAVLVYFEWS